MKTFAAVLTSALILIPAVASAEYLCPRLWAEKHGQTCAPGAHWDAYYSACIKNG